MTAPSYCVLDGDGSHAPRRPASDGSDTGGLLFQDALGKNAPRPNEDMSSKDFMQVEMLLERALRTLPVLQVDFAGTSGATGVISAQTVVVANDTLPTSEVVVSKLGTGAYQIEFTTGKLPAITVKPRITTGGTFDARLVCNQAANVVTIFAYASGGALTNSFEARVDIYGE